MYSLQTNLNLNYRSNGFIAKPILLLLHGVGGNEKDLLRFEAYFPDFHLISVQAPILLNGERYAWFNVSFTPEPIHNAQEAEESRQQLITFLDELQQTYKPATKPFLLGFSQGAIMSLSLALTVPDNFAGVVAMSGRILQECSQTAKASANLKKLPVLLSHGRFDQKLPIYHAQSSKEILEPITNLSYREYDKAHEITPQMLSETNKWLENHTLNSI